MKKLLFSLVLIVLFIPLCGMDEEQTGEVKITSKKSRFYVKLPKDKYWNTDMEMGVIKAFEKKNKNGGIDLVVLSSEKKLLGYYAYNVRDMWFDPVKGKCVRTPVFLACEGPVRKLSLQEYFELIHALQPNRTLPENYKKVIKKK